MRRLLPILRWFAVVLAVAIVVAQAIARYRQNTPNVVESGTAKVGAPFTLTDTTGRRISDTDLRGRNVVLVFGWTRDPDVAPAMLQLLMAAKSLLGPKDDRFLTVFITVDPARDGNLDFYYFSKSYESEMLMLRGSEDETAALTKAFRFPITRVSDPVLPNGYSLDHPAVYYILGKDGSFRGAIPYTTDVRALAGELQKLAR